MRNRTLSRKEKAWETGLSCANIAKLPQTICGKRTCPRNSGSTQINQAKTAKASLGNEKHNHKQNALAISPRVCHPPPEVACSNFARTNHLISFTIDHSSSSNVYIIYAINANAFSRFQCTRNKILQKIVNLQLTDPVYIPVLDLLFVALYVSCINDLVWIVSLSSYGVMWHATDARASIHSLSPMFRTNTVKRLLDTSLSLKRILIPDLEV